MGTGPAGGAAMEPAPPRIQLFATARSFPGWVPETFPGTSTTLPATRRPATPGAASPTAHCTRACWRRTRLPAWWGEDGAIVHLSGRAGRSLRIQGGEPTRNLLDLTVGDLRTEPRAAFDRRFLPPRALHGNRASVD